MADPTVTEGPVETARLRLHVLRAAPAAPQGRVLVLGGSNFDLRLKRQFLATPLAHLCEIVAYEPRGIGRSAHPPGDWTMADYAADAAALLDALGWDQADVLGESFGGMTALHLARRAPDRVRRLALASATAGGAGGASVDLRPFLSLPPEDAAARALALQDSAFDTLRTTEPAAYARKLAERRAFEAAFADPSVTSGGYARLLAARARHDIWDALPQIPHPTLVLIGMRDRQAPPAAQRAMAARLPEAEVLAFDAGHGLAFATPAVMEALCARWHPSAAGPSPHAGSARPGRAL